MIGLLVAGLFLMGLLVVPVLFAVLLFQAAVVDATPETSPTGQPGHLPVPGAVAGEGDALARGLPPGADDLLAGTLPARRTTQR